MKNLSSLTLRLLSSLVLIPIVIGIIWIGGWVFAGFATLCLVIALYEWINIIKNIDTTSLKKNLLYILGLIYLGFSLYEIICLRIADEGFFLTLLFMLCIWASDSGAYLLGKTIGGPKMSPTISPNKTWSGYVGALLFPAFLLFITAYIMSGDRSFYPSVWVGGGIAIGIAGQSGDLMISALKRKAGLKDTGSLIPGHGGILDRIDSLLLAIPVYLGFLKYLEAS